MSLEAIRANAQLVIDHLNGVADQEIGLNAASVEWIEGYILRNRETWDATQTDRMVSIFGSFLGEAVIAENGGIWEYDENGWGVVLAGNQRAFPINKMAKFIEGGIESGDSISSFMRVIPMLIERAANRDDNSDSD